MEAPVGEATGYHFCLSDAAARLRRKYGRSGNAVTFVIPGTGQDTKEAIETALEQAREDADQTVYPCIEETTMTICNPTTGNKKPARVWLVHVDEWKRILPAHKMKNDVMDDIDLPAVLPDLKMEMASTTEIQVTVIAPMCKEIGLEGWWSKLKDRTFTLLREDLKKAITSQKCKPSEPRVRRDRRLTWRGEEWDEGRILATFQIPTEQVDDVMNVSGRHGIVVDVFGRNSRASDGEQARIRLPVEWTLAEVLEKMDALPQQLKKELRGIVPTFKGYAIRVRKQFEAEVTRALNPEVAEELGASLGMKPSSTWLVKSIPRQATRAGIIKTFAAAQGQWTGWKVLPRKIHGQPRGTTVDWIVDAECEPPRKVVTLNGACIMVERFIERPRVPPRAAAWFRNTATDPIGKDLVEEGALWAHEQKSNEEQRQAPREREAEENSEVNAAGSAGNENSPTVPAEGNSVDPNGKGGRNRTVQAAPYPNVRAAKGEGKAKGSKEEQGSQQQLRGQQGDAHGDAMISQLIEHLKGESIKKDAMIAELQRANAVLQETVNEMNRQMAQMQATLAQMQQAAAGKAEDH